MTNIYLKLLNMAPAIKNPVLATVTGTEGSTPQKPGSSAICGNGVLITGTVGGGVVEGRTVELAQEYARTKESHYFHYNLDNNVTDPEEAICGGRITILIDADPLAHLPVLSMIGKSLSEREAGVLITKVSEINETSVTIDRYWVTGKIRPDLPASVTDKIDPVIKEMLSLPGSYEYKRVDITIPGERKASSFYLESVFPLPELIIAGAGHIGKALSHLGKLIGFEVTVIDNRSEYANPYYLPDADHIIMDDIGKAVENIEKHSDTFIVIVTRGHSDDAVALKPCIGSGAGYVGMIGSREKVAKMHSDFINKAWATEDQWKRIYTPIGLDIRSKTVEEIAVSIAAQLVLVRNSRKRDSSQ